MFSVGSEFLTLFVQYLLHSCTVLPTSPMISGQLGTVFNTSSSPIAPATDQELTYLPLDRLFCVGRFP